MAGHGKLDLKGAYISWTSRMKAAGSRGLEKAVGGEFTAFGIVQRDMLYFYGLGESDYLIDVGCGSGRLAIPLGRTHTGRYLGTDLVPDLIAHAAEQTQRSDWRFEVVSGLAIPEKDGQADMVCMFSVLTHLLHEQMYIYLSEVARVLRPEGRLVFSFLEFAMSFHWTVFEQTVADEKGAQSHPLNVFLERNVIEVWAKRLGFKVIEFRDGSDAFVPLRQSITLDSGQVMERFGNLGQSICVLEKVGPEAAGDKPVGGADLGA